MWLNVVKKTGQKQQNASESSKKASKVLKDVPKD